MAEFGELFIAATTLEMYLGQFCVIKVRIRRYSRVLTKNMPCSAKLIKRTKSY